MVYGDIITTEGINGFNISEVNKRAFKLYGDNVVTAPLEFEDNITLADLNVEDISGINITRLGEDSLKKTGDIQYVKEDVVFEAGFDVVGDIIATKVNDLVLAEDILLKTVPQTIKGVYFLCMASLITFSYTESLLHYTHKYFETGVCYTLSVLPG